MGISGDSGGVSIAIGTGGEVGTCMSGKVICNGVVDCAFAGGGGNLLSVSYALLSLS